MTDERRSEGRPQPGVITIKNWKRFQSYKFRNPPWIRLYADVVEQDWYRPLPDSAARFLFELWLLARRDRGKIPYDTLMILRDLHRPTSDKPLLDTALRELASADAITIAGTDASAVFLDSLAHRVSDLQSFRVSESIPTESGASPPRVEEPMRVLMPDIRTHLYRDTKPPEGWDDGRCATICRGLLRVGYSVDDLREAIRVVPLVRAGKVPCDDSLRKFFLKRPTVTMAALYDRWGSGLVLDQLLHIVRKNDLTPLDAA